MNKKIIFTLLLLSFSVIIFSSDFDLSFLGNINNILKNEELSNLAIYVENTEQNLKCKPFSDYLSINISEKIINDCNYINLVERDDLNLIEDELLLQCNGLFDDENAVFLGHLIGAQAMLFVKYTILNNAIQCSNRVFNIETGEILFTHSFELILNDKLKEMMNTSVYYFYATGIGQEPDNVNLSKSMKRQMAKRVAKANSYRNLLEIVKGASISSRTEIDNMTIDEDKIIIQSQGHLANAEVVETKELEEGVYQVKTLLRLPQNELRN